MSLSTLPEGVQASELNQLALNLYEAKQYNDALKVSALGLAKWPNHFELLGNHAAVCHALDLHGEGLSSCLQQIAIRQSDARVWVNAGNALRAMGNLAESEQCLRRAVAMGGCDGAAQYNLALTLLLAGNLEEGFTEYERRFESSLFKQWRRNFAVPLWDGSSLEGKRILIWQEQGNGDAIQFVRYLPLLREMGGEVLLETPPHLERFFRAAGGEIQFVQRGGAANFDVHCPLLSLAYKTGTIPDPPKIVLPGETTKAWRQRVDELTRFQPGALRVGLVWAGNPGHTNDHNRSLELAELQKLFEVPACCLFSLQVGPASGRLAELNYPIHDLAPFLTDYLEAAAAVEQMDLVIAVDTSVAHLAGAMGKRVWTLIPHAPDWRWMLHQTTTHWYPSMRLFRQDEPKNWSPVVERVAEELTAVSGKK